MLQAQKVSSQASGSRGLQQQNRPSRSVLGGGRLLRQRHDDAGSQLNCRCQGLSTYWSEGAVESWGPLAAGKGLSESILCPILGSSSSVNIEQLDKMTTPITLHKEPAPSKSPIASSSLVPKSPGSRDSSVTTPPPLQGKGCGPRRGILRPLGSQLPHGVTTPTTTTAGTLTQDLQSVAVGTMSFGRGLSRRGRGRGILGLRGMELGRFEDSLSVYKPSASSPSNSEPAVGDTPPPVERPSLSTGVSSPGPEQLVSSEPGAASPAEAAAMSMPTLLPEPSISVPTSQTTAIKPHSEWVPRLSSAADPAVPPTPSSSSSSSSSLSSLGWGRGRGRGRGLMMYFASMLPGYGADEGARMVSLESKDEETDSTTLPVEEAAEGSATTSSGMNLTSSAADVGGGEWPSSPEEAAGACLKADDLSVSLDLSSPRAGECGLSPEEKGSFFSGSAGEDVQTSSPDRIEAREQFLLESLSDVGTVPDEPSSSELLVSDIASPKSLPEGEVHVSNPLPDLPTLSPNADSPVVPAQSLPREDPVTCEPLLADTPTLSPGVGSHASEQTSQASPPRDIPALSMTDVPHSPSVDCTAGILSDADPLPDMPALLQEEVGGGVGVKRSAKSPTGVGKQRLSVVLQKREPTSKTPASQKPEDATARLPPEVPEEQASAEPVQGSQRSDVQPPRAQDLVVVHSAATSPAGGGTERFPSPATTGVRKRRKKFNLAATFLPPSSPHLRSVRATSLPPRSACWQRSSLPAEPGPLSARLEATPPSGLGSVLASSALQPCSEGDADGLPDGSSVSAVHSPPPPPPPPSSFPPLPECAEPLSLALSEAADPTSTPPSMEPNSPVPCSASEATSQSAASSLPSSLFTSPVAKPPLAVTGRTLTKPGALTGECLTTETSQEAAVEASGPAAAACLEGGKDHSSADLAGEERLRSRDEVEQRIAELQRSVHCRQVELEKVDRKNKAMEEELCSELQSMERGDAPAATSYMQPDRLKAFDALMKLNARAVMASEKLKISAEIREDFKQRSYSKFTTDKLSKLELDLVLREDELKEQVEAAKARSSLLHGKLDFYINDNIN